MGIPFDIFSLLLSCYLYYEFIDDGLLPRLWLFGTFGAILSFCFGLGNGNHINDVNVLNTIALIICAFSLEENTAFFIRKLKKYIELRKEKKENFSPN